MGGKAVYSTTKKSPGSMKLCIEVGDWGGVDHKLLKVKELKTLWNVGWLVLWCWRMMTGGVGEKTLN